MDRDEMAVLLRELIENAGSSDEGEDGGFVTTREMAFAKDRADISHADRRRLALLVKKGKVEMKMVRRKSITGAPYTCPGYRVVS